MRKSSLLIKYFTEGYELAKSLGDKTSMYSNSQGIALANADSKNYKDAYDYILLSTKIKDTIYSLENTNAVYELEAKFQNEKKTIRN